MIGHYLPVYYSFIGGRGETIMLGAMFVANWFGTLLVNVVSTILGFITGSVVVLRYAGYISYDILAVALFSRLPVCSFHVSYESFICIFNEKGDSKNYRTEKERIDEND